MFITESPDACSNLDLRSYGKALAAAPRHRVGKQGQHLFTLDVGGQLIASKLVRGQKI